MTRFNQEISGNLGEYWKKSAQAEVQRDVEKANEDAVVENDGAIRWKMGNYIPDDFCERLEYAGYPFSREATAKKREIQTKQFLCQYRKQKHQISAEMKMEMDANFEPGTTVVDVISGEKYITK